MPDLLASFQINVPLPGLVPAVPLRAAPVAVPGGADFAPDFATALSGLLIPGAAPKAKGERQAPAEDGKELPVAVESADGLIAWLPEGIVPMALPAAVPLSDTGPVAPGGVTIGTDAEPAISVTQAAQVPTAIGGAALPEATEAPAPLAASVALPPSPAPAVPPSVAMPAATQSAAAFRTDALPSGAVNSILVEVSAAPIDAPIEMPSAPVEPDELAAIRSRFETPTRDAVRAPTPPTIALQPAAMPVALTTGAAAQVFATALTAPTLDAAPLDLASERAILLHGQARTEQLTTVQAMSGGAQVALDMTRDDWTGQMIERIAALQDAAEAVDTRIKLAPENLGALEVSIRRDGDRIHVHFAADNPAARQMIADAAPRLAELADARGVKLGQTSVEAGNGGASQQGGQRDAQQEQPRAAMRNASAAVQSEPTTDQRIA